MDERSPVVLSWSGGKDSALALAALRQMGEAVHCLLTTVTEDYDRISMHGVRRELLHAQARAARLPLQEVHIPKDCTNDIYEARMGDVVRQLAAQGAHRFAFGDLFLEDVRAYREVHLQRAGLQALFPLWRRDTSQLAQTFVAEGFRAVIVAVDPRQLPIEFIGRDYDARLLHDLPATVDPCGEHGEFHSFVWDGPVFDRPIPILRGDAVLRDGFWFQDLLPADSSKSCS
ncbi:MAG: adenine nucleotide alpha hydrolase [Thermaerobacter sp.]|nr:adenine nucleotide alpha hydrolase [Thermaerobacter sp.]